MAANTGQHVVKRLCIGYLVSERPVWNAIEIAPSINIERGTVARPNARGQPRPFVRRIGEDRLGFASCGKESIKNATVTFRPTLMKYVADHSDWSGCAEYDLDAPGRIVDLYRAVLNEAASPQDLYEYLDAGMLRRLWATLWLPAQLRTAWEQKFPVLAEISRVTAA